MLPYLILGGLATWFLSTSGKKKKKRVFISFAIEDKKFRDYLVDQSRRPNSPFEFIDMSVKTNWENNIWKKRCRTKIKRCHGFIVLLSKNTIKASGAKWEIKCAKEENVRVIGMHIRKNETDYKIPSELQNEKTIIWTWENLEKFIKQL